MESITVTGMIIFDVCLLILIFFFIRGSFLVEKIRKIVFKLGKDAIDPLDVEELIKFLEKHELPLRFYAKNLLRSAFQLVELNGDKLELDLKLRLHRSILRRGVIV